MQFFLGPGWNRLLSDNERGLNQFRDNLLALDDDQIIVVHAGAVDADQMRCRGGIAVIVGDLDGEVEDLVRCRGRLADAETADVELAGDALDQRDVVDSRRVELDRVPGMSNCSKAHGSHAKTS